jgi:hypothetical protein
MFDARLTVRPETLAATRRPARVPGGAAGLIALQRKIGNKAMGRLVAPEAPLKVDNDDALEREADRAADEVLATPEPVGALSAAPVQIGRKCAACEDEDEKKRIQRKPDSAAAPATDAAASVHHALSAPGRPLDRATRAYFEPRFGRDLSGVRIHADADADASAREIDAEAYAAGERVVFARGRYDPQSEAGRRLLAHELAHVVQQTGGRDQATVRRQPKGRAKAPARKDYGRVLFVQVDRGANSIAFVTESGTLVYPLIEPTAIAAGSYRFNVSFPSYYNLQLSAPAQTSGYSGFKYKIAVDKPNPADLLRKEKTVDVLVTDNGPGQGGGSASADAKEGAETRSIPVTYVAVPLDEPGPAFGGGRPSVPGVPGFTTGAGLGLHNFAFNDLSWLDTPLSTPYWSPLVPRSGILLDRSTNTLPRNLTPTLQSYLANNKPGDALTWLRSSDRRPILFQPDPASPAQRAFTAEELLSIDPLVRRYNANSASLNPAELQLLREAARIHIGSSSPTAPFSSFSRPGTLVSWTRDRRYVVRVLVDRSAALDVHEPNAFNQGVEALTNVEEAEFLVVGDQTGRIVSVQTVKSLEEGGASWAVRNAGAIRWGGRILLIAGVAYSGYRIGSASPEERPRVIGEEAGGQVGGIAGSALATAGCIAFAIATEGIGLLLCGLAGGVIGGGAGSAVGGAVGAGTSGLIEDWAQEAYLRQLKQQGDPIPPEAQGAADFWLGPPLF